MKVCRFYKRLKNFRWNTPNLESVLYITFGTDYKSAPAGVLLLSSIVHLFTYLGDITSIFFSSQAKIRITYPNIY